MKSGSISKWNHCLSQLLNISISSSRYYHLWESSCPCSVWRFVCLEVGTDKQELEVELLFIKGRIYSNPYIYPLVFICLTDLRVVAWSQGIKGPAWYSLSIRHHCYIMWSSWSTVVINSHDSNPYTTVRILRRDPVSLAVPLRVYV